MLVYKTPAGLRGIVCQEAVGISVHHLRATSPHRRCGRLLSAGDDIFCVLQVPRHTLTLLCVTSHWLSSSISGPRNKVLGNHSNNTRPIRCSLIDAVRSYRPITLPLFPSWYRKPRWVHKDDFWFGLSSDQKGFKRLHWFWPIWTFLKLFLHSI